MGNQREIIDIASEITRLRNIVSNIDKSINEHEDALRANQTKKDILLAKIKTLVEQLDSKAVL